MTGITIERAERTFKFNGIPLQDPGADMSPEKVKEFYATLYPELTNAEIEGPKQQGAKLHYEFRKAVGTKGAPRHLRVKPLHSDEIACRIGCERTMGAMIEKLRRKREDGNRGGWNIPAQCKVDDLADMLIQHIKKGDPVDIANFAMMLHNRDGGDRALARAYHRHNLMVRLDLRDAIVTLLKPKLTKVIHEACRV